MDAIKRLVSDHRRDPLEGLYDRIMQAVGNHGKQDDDQTLMLVRSKK
jgi:hypothetical protein